MRAFTLDSFGAQPALRDDIPGPHVADNEVLVRVHASSVNPVDMFIAAGALKEMAQHEFPVILGRDFAGVVEQVGSAVSRYRIGDEVFGFLLHANPAVHDGSWAELISVPEDNFVAAKPRSVDFAHAGAAPRVETQGLTLVGLALTGLEDDGAIQLALPLDRRQDAALDAALDEVHDRFGSAAVTRAVLLGRDPGLAMPLLPD